MLRRLLPALPLCLLLGAGAAPAQACEAIRVAPGASSGEVAGLAPPDGVRCYALEVGEGRRARVRVLDGRNVAFSVEGRVDAQADYAFVTERGTDRILVFQLLRAVAPEPFVLEVSVTGGRVEAPGGWRLDEGEGRASALAWLGPEGGPAGAAPEGGGSVAVNCAAGAPEPRLSMIFDGIEAGGLPEGGGAGAVPGWIEIDMAPEPRRYPVRLLYSEGYDPFWEVVEGLSPPLLDDLARGSRLRLLDASGAAAGEVGLAGSARLREAFARRCGL